MKEEDNELLKNDNDLQIKSNETDDKSNSENQIVKYLKSIIPTVIIGIGSFVLVLFL